MSAETTNSKRQESVQKREVTKSNLREPAKPAQSSDLEASPSVAATSGISSSANVSVLQRTVGNQTVTSLIQAKSKNKKTGVQPTVKGPGSTPVSWTEHAAGPSVVDFGKVPPGTVGRAAASIWNTTNARAAISVSYVGDPAIQIESVPGGPYHMLEDAQHQTIEDLRDIKLVFSAPNELGSHYGTLYVSLSWVGGTATPASETLTIPVVAHSLYKNMDTPDEKATKEKTEKEEEKKQAAEEKQKAKEEHNVEEFSKAHPRVYTDDFNDAASRLENAMQRLVDMQLSGVEAAREAVMKYKKQPPPAPDTLLSDLIGLVVEIGTAGVAGLIAKSIETALKEMTFIKIALPIEHYTWSELSAPTIALLTDSVKETIKGTGKVVRKNLSGHSDKGSKGDDHGNNDDNEWTDPRIRYFKDQRTLIIQDGGDQHDQALRIKKLLRPTLLKNPTLAVNALNKMSKAIDEKLPSVSDIRADEAIRGWIKYIYQLDASPRLMVNEAGSVTGGKMNEVRGMIDIGFQSAGDPLHPVVVKSAILRGVSNTIARRLWKHPLLELNVPVRAYGLPGPNEAQLAVTVVRTPDGSITWVDRSYGSAPKSSGTWLGRKGGPGGEELGAKILMEREIMSKSLEKHQVQLVTDQDPSIEIEGITK